MLLSLQLAVQQISQNYHIKFWWYTQFISNLASDRPVEYHLYNLGCISNITWGYQTWPSLWQKHKARHGGHWTNNHLPSNWQVAAQTKIWSTFLQRIGIKLCCYASSRCTDSNKIVYSKHYKNDTPKHSTLSNQRACWVVRLSKVIFLLLVNVCMCVPCNTEWNPFRVARIESNSFSIMYCNSSWLHRPVSYWSMLLAYHPAQCRIPADNQMHL